MAKYDEYNIFPPQDPYLGNDQFEMLPTGVAQPLRTPPIKPQIGLPPDLTQPEQPGVKERVMAEVARRMQGPRPEATAQPGDDLGRKTKSAAVMNAILSGISGLGDLNVFGGGGLRGGQQAPQTTDRMGKHFGMQDKIMAPLQQKRAMEDQAKLAQTDGKAVKPKEFSQATIMKINEGARLPMAMDNVESMIGAASSKFGKYKGLLWKGLGKVAGGTVEKLDARMAAVRQMYGKLMEGGVLRKEDEKKYEKQFPKSNDTLDTALFKIRSLNAMLKRDVQDGLKRFQAQGYDTTGYEDVMEWAIQEPSLTEKQTVGGKPQKDNTVRVRSPEGKTGTIPIDQLQEALGEGYTRIE
jgi:hypothetical protein